MADLYLATLRAIHVLTAVFWAGGTFLLAGFHDFVLDHGDDDRRKLDRMFRYSNMSRTVGLSGIIAAITGLLMYWTVSGNLDPDWITSPYGLAITIGAAAGISSIIVAVPFLGLTNSKVEALHEKVENGESITEEESEKLETFRGRILLGERSVAILLAIAVLAMSTAQYL